MPTPDELIALFGDDFGDVLQGLNALPVEVRELLDGTMGKMVHDAEIFSQRVNQTVTTQRDIVKANEEFQAWFRFDK